MSVMQREDLPARVVVVGTSGSGKSTTAGQLAALLGAPHVELDALHWEPNWIEAPDEVMAERLQAAVAGERWVVDGNYTRMRHLVWPRADTVLWLDYSFPLVMGQVLWRTLHRSVTRHELWGGNRESLAKAFLSRDSILLWALQTWRQNRRKYEQLSVDHDYPHLRVVRLRSRRQTAAYLGEVARAASAGRAAAL